MLLEVAGILLKCTCKISSKSLESGFFFASTWTFQPVLKQLCQILIFRIMRYFGCHREKQSYRVQEFGCLFLIKFMACQHTGSSYKACPSQWHDPFTIPLPLRLMDQMISEPKASSSISVMQRCSPSIKSTCHSILLQGVFIKRYVKCSVASSCSDKGPKLASGTMTTALSFNK